MWSDPAKRAGTDGGALMPPPESTNVAPRRRLHISIVVLCIAASFALTFAYVFVLIQSHYSDYDDEGFMLQTLRQYMGGAQLYDAMYTEYGPFYYLAHSTVFTSAGWTVSHDRLRFLSMIMWVLVASGWAVCVWIWQRSIAWSLTALLTTAVILRALKWEPGHPQILILLLYTFVFVAASLYKKAPDSIVCLALGAASGAMLLTKINIGIFISAALAAVFTLCLPTERRPRGLDPGLRAFCVAIPTVLMHRQFTDPAVIFQCAVYTFG